MTETSTLAEVITWGFSVLVELLEGFSTILPTLAYVILYLAIIYTIVKMFDKVLSWVDTAFKFKK
jgi:uncharacterized membrane protein YuzA (DUF378 family)